MSELPKIEKRGPVVINDIWRVIQHENVAVWQMDLRTKRAAVGVVMEDDDDRVLIQFVPGEGCLHLDAAAPDATTVVTFPKPSDVGEDEGVYWQVEASVSRYTGTVIIWRDDREDRMELDAHVVGWGDDPKLRMIDSAEEWLRIGD